MKLFRCHCLRNIAKSIFFELNLGPWDTQFFCHHQICLPCFFSHWHGPRVGSQEVSLPPPPTMCPCSRKQRLSLQQRSLWENAGSLAGEEDSRKREKKERRKAQKGKEGAREWRSKWGQPGLRRRHTGRYIVWLFSHIWRPSEGRLMSQQSKLRFQSNSCLSSKEKKECQSSPVT